MFIHPLFFVQEFSNPENKFIIPQPSDSKIRRNEKKKKTVPLFKP